MKKLLGLSLCSLSVFASTITFNEALNDTFKNNNELKAKKVSIEMAKQNLEEAKSYDWGKLIFKEELSYTNNALYVFGDKLQSREAKMGDFGFTKIPPGGTPVGTVQPKALNNPDPRFNVLTKLNYKIPIFTGYKLKYAKEMAKLQVKANQFKFQRDKNKLAIEVLKAYNGAVAAKQFIKALKIAKKTTESFIKTTGDMFSEGMVVRSDLLSSQARDSDVKAKLIEAESKYKLALAYLRFLTGNNDITDVGDFKVIISPNKDLSDLEKDGLNNRNDLKYMKFNVTTMQKKVKMDSSVDYPTIGAQVEYGFNDNRINNLSLTKDYYMMGVGLSYDIFDGHKKRVLKEKAKLEAKKVSYYYAHMQNGIKLDIEQKYLNLQAKTAIIKERLAKKALATQVLNQYESMYKNGLVNISILLLKEAELEKARAEVVKAKYDQALAAADLQLSVGNLIKK